MPQSNAEPAPTRSPSLDQFRPDPDPRLSALLSEIETDIRAARRVADDDEMPDECFGWEERTEIANRLTDALTKLRSFV